MQMYRKKSILCLSIEDKGSVTMKDCHPGRAGGAGEAISIDGRPLTRLDKHQDGTDSFSTGNLEFLEFNLLNNDLPRCNKLAFQI